MLHMISECIHATMEELSSRDRDFMWSAKQKNIYNMPFRGERKSLQMCALERRLPALERL